MRAGIVFAAIAAAAVIAIAAVKIYQSVSGSTVSGEGFAVYDENSHLHYFSEYTDKPVIINIWATWCPPCRKELPAFEKMYREYGSQVQFMMIDSEGKESFDSVKKFIKDGGYTFPVFYDWDDSAYDTYGTGYIPITIAIDKNGKIVYNETGGMSESQLRAVVKSIL